MHNGHRLLAFARRQVTEVFVQIGEQSAGILRRDRRVDRERAGGGAGRLQGSDRRLDRQGIRLVGAVDGIRLLAVGLAAREQERKHCRHAVRRHRKTTHHYTTLRFAQVTRSTSRRSSAS